MLRKRSSEELSKGCQQATGSTEQSLNVDWISMACEYSCRGEQFAWPLILIAGGRPIWVFLWPLPIFRNQGSQWRYMMPIFWADIFGQFSKKNSLPSTPLQGSFESVPRPPLQGGLSTLVWSTFGVHPSAIAAFSSAQTNRTKRSRGLNLVWFNRTKYGRSESTLKD